MLVAFDLDGTLCDLSHRLHHILNAEGVKNWPEFFRRCEWDEPIEPMVELCNMMITCGGGTEVIFVSGRNSVCQEATIRWLRQNIMTLGGLELGDPEHGFVDQCRRPLLYMRDEDDRRPDYKVKRELLLRIIEDRGQRPDLVFDDRQQVVDMWREHGIRCCQVAPGNF